MSSIFLPAKRMETISFSPIRVISEKAALLKQKGEDVVLFTMGEPDFPTPDPIREATILALNEGMTHYTSNRGALNLRKVIASQLKDSTGLSYDPETEILVTTGAAEGIHHLFTAFINPGDEVILFTPAFVNYKNAIEICGGVAVEVPLKLENRFEPDAAETKRFITNKTRMIILNNPCNPTGAVFSERALEELCALAESYKLIVATDEIYSSLVYGMASFRSAASFPNMRSRTVIINGFSKAYAMTGWRIGYMAASSEAISTLLKVHQYTTTSGNTFCHEGIARSIISAQTVEIVRAMKESFERRRDLIVELLSCINGISFAPPRGAFYVLIDISSTGLSGEDFAQRLLEEKKVAVIPAGGMGRGFESFVRLSFALSEERIIEGITRFEDFTKKYIEKRNN